MIYNKHTSKTIANAVLVVSLLSTSIIFAADELEDVEGKRAQEITCSSDAVPPRL